jgi:hypothetical protein
VSEVTALTPTAEIIKMVIVFVAIHMRRGEDHDAPCFRMGLVIFSTAIGILWGSFAAILTIVDHGSTAN